MRSVVPAIVFVLSIVSPVQAQSDAETAAEAKLGLGTSERGLLRSKPRTSGLADINEGMGRLHEPVNEPQLARAEFDAASCGRATRSSS